MEEERPVVDYDYEAGAFAMASGKALGAAASEDGSASAGARVVNKFADVSPDGKTIRAGATANAFGIAMVAPDNASGTRTTRMAVQHRGPALEQESPSME